VGPNTKTVQRKYEDLVSQVGPELYILEHAPLEDVKRAGSSLLAEGISRMRKGRVIRDAGSTANTARSDFLPRMNYAAVHP